MRFAKLIGKVLLLSLIPSLVLSSEKAYGQRNPQPVEITSFVNLPISETVINDCAQQPVLFGHRLFNVHTSDNPTLYLNQNLSDLRNQRFNDIAGSICVPGGWTVKVYGLRGYERFLYEFNGVSLESLLNQGYTIGEGTIVRYWNFPSGSDMNDIISSVKVYREVLGGAPVECTNPCRFF